MSIEEMLKAGKKPEEMMKEMQEQIKEAQDKIAKEKAAAAKEDRAVTRQGLAMALLKYLSTFDELADIKQDIELNQENVEDLTKVIEESEDSIIKFMDLIKTMVAFEDTLSKAVSNSEAAAPAKRGVTSDDIISNFLKGII